MRSRGYYAVGTFLRAEPKCTNRLALRSAQYIGNSEGRPVQGLQRGDYRRASAFH